MPYQVSPWQTAFGGRAAPVVDSQENQQSKLNSLKGLADNPLETTAQQYAASLRANLAQPAPQAQPMSQAPATIEAPPPSPQVQQTAQAAAGAPVGTQAAPAAAPLQSLQHLAAGGQEGYGDEGLTPLAAGLGERNPPSSMAALARLAGQRGGRVY